MSKFYINPYNFIPYSGEVAREKQNGEATSEPLLTGEIKCSLSIKTPLAIPDTEERFMSKTYKDHYIYPFMTVGGIPIIPSSELRGMVRNVYETITNSCFSIINCNTLSQRDGQPLKKAGLLSWDDGKKQWQLYEANRRAYFTKTTLNAAKNQINKEQIPYVVRQWTLFPSLLSSWNEMREFVNQAICSSHTMEEFKAALEKQSLHFCELYKKEKTTKEKEEDDPIILCWKKDYDDYQRDKKKVKFDTKRVNLEKKWGPQYSKKNIGKYLGKEKLDDRCYDPFISASVFVRSGAEPLALPEQQMKTLLTVFDFYYDYNKGSENEKAREEQLTAVLPDVEKAARTGKMVPVFYEANENNSAKTVTRLAPAQISRKIFGHTVESLLGQTGHAPCTDTKHLCPACRLFGTVIQDGAVSSKLHFSDAVGSDVKLCPESMDKEEDIPTLKELSSPRLTSIEFYSLLKNMRGYKDQERWHYDSTDVTLRGRKIYLHNPKAELKSEEEIKQAVFCTNERTKRNSSMQLATDGAFIFSVYFNGITENELKTLVWALTLGDTDGTTSLHHKLGHGRPLGLGSVKLTVSEIVKRTTDGNAYCAKPESVGADYFNGFTLPIEGTDTLTALKAAFDFEYMANLPGNQHVAYPIGRKGSNAKTSENTMQWFSQNHAAVGRNGKYRYVLHPIVKNGRKASVSVLLLPYLSDEAADGNASGGQRGNGGQQPAGGQRNNGSQQGGGNHGSNHGNSREPAPVTLYPGEESDAVITFIKESRNGQLFINFDANGTPGSLHKSNFSAEIQTNPDGTIGKLIRVRYLGKDDKGYNRFKLISE